MNEISFVIIIISVSAGLRCIIITLPCSQSLSASAKPCDCHWPARVIGCQLLPVSWDKVIIHTPLECRRVLISLTKPWAGRWWCHCLWLTARPTVTFPACTGTKSYCLVTEAHVCERGYWSRINDVLIASPASHHYATQPRCVVPCKMQKVIFSALFKTSLDYTAHL